MVEPDAFSNEKPTKPGWYWWRSDADDEHPQVIEVDFPRNSTELFMWLHSNEGGDRLFGQFGPKVPDARRLDALESLLLDCGMIMSKVLVVDEDDAITQLGRPLMRAMEKRTKAVLDYFAPVPAEAEVSS